MRVASERGSGDSQTQMEKSPHPMTEVEYKNEDTDEFMESIEDTLKKGKSTVNIRWQLPDNHFRHRLDVSIRLEMWEAMRSRNIVMSSGSPGYMTVRFATEHEKKFDQKRGWFSLW